MVKQKVQPLNFEKEYSDLNRVLLLFNDDINTFEFVIHTLIEVCNHDPEQAEQCAFIAHTKGKCDIKSGNYLDLKIISDEMTLRGLTVSIE
jgi:ATP-dependent Clp protease adaptor protein ClpS